jgi:ABC-type lipoprotein export system ATPase subunit
MFSKSSLSAKRLLRPRGGRGLRAAGGTAVAPLPADARASCQPHPAHVGQRPAKLIQLRDIRKTYWLGEAEVHALDGVSLDIDRGEYVALMGPSGSGKSTLMNTLGCLDHPSSGSYRLEGEEVVAMSEDQRARLRNHKIGFVFQNFNLLSRTSALENVELPLLYSHQFRGRQRRQRVRALLAKVGLGARLDHHPAQLSGGEQQRVAIARALANQPPILLADEPTGNLDSHASRDLLGLFRQLNEEDGITIIMVTHDRDVARHARRAVVICDGRIICDTTDFARALAALDSRQEEEA